jgi:hypothetical protein
VGDADRPLIDATAAGPGTGPAAVLRRSPVPGYRPGRLAPAALVMAYRGVAAGCRYGGGMTPRAAAVTLAAVLALAGCSSSGSPAAPSASWLLNTTDAADEL